MSQPEVRWDARVLEALFAGALLGYLAIAHHGRGRGAWVAQEPPAAWVAAVEAAFTEQQAALQALSQRAAGGETPEALALRVQGLIESACADVLTRLYPMSRALLEA